MKFIVVELQTQTTGAVGNIVTAFDTLAAAESKYHTVLAAAAISDLPEHAAVLIDSKGHVLESRCYEH